ncbi:MAG: hypothetical protein Q7T88_11375 [Methylotenera sp.]|nr:hypothetical protein [Methylotenera sp.]
MSYQMRRLSFNGLVSLGLLLSLDATAAVTDITRIYQQVPALSGFDICTGGGCAEINHVSLNNQEWKKIVTIFTDAGIVTDAKQERKLIAAAIGKLEKMIGAKTGTTTDRAGTFGNSNYSGQLDCNDEAINSTTYMRLMHQNGLIKLHEVEDMRTRNFFFSGWPHSTAVMHEIRTGDRYAVDSWFYDNGFPATIVPFAVWKSGYIPQDSPLTKGRSVTVDVPAVQKNTTAE